MKVNFVISAKVTPDMSKKVRWALAKDDVTQRYFNLTRGDAKDRAIVAKYCIQDCNLVQYLLNKVMPLQDLSKWQTLWCSY